MAQILCKYDEITVSNVSNFYERRIRRIVPTFLLVVSIVLCAGRFILVGDDFGVLSSDAVPALTFTTNIFTLFESDDYWAQVQQKNGCVPPTNFLHLSNFAFE